MNMIKEIKRLKQENDAIIIAHNYQLPEIQDIADYLGDSLQLSQISADIENKLIVFCGVKFMAETAKILSPQKTVIIPEINAGCAMAAMVDVNELLRLKEKYPDAKVVSYVNTTAQIKAYSDICCTSSNAVKIVNSIDAKKIIFVPDKNLAYYVQQHTDKEIIPYNGYCYVHDQFTIDDIKKVRENHPNAIIFVHPESPPEVQVEADYILSTGGMQKKAKEINKPIIIGTEEGMIYRLKTLYPNKEFYPLRAYPPAICKNMKTITLEKLYDALKQLKYSIEINEEIREKAFNAIKRMLELS